MFPLGCGGQTTKGGNPATINYRQDEPVRGTLQFNVRRRCTLQRRIAKLRVPKRVARSTLVARDPRREGFHLVFTTPCLLVKFSICYGHCTYERVRALS